MSFKKKFKLFTEISILLPAENTNYYWFVCTQCTHSCPETKHISLKLCHLPQLMPNSITPLYVQNYGHTELHYCIGIQDPKERFAPYNDLNWKEETFRRSEPCQ